MASDFTALDAIAELDAALVVSGKDVTLRRGNGSSPEFLTTVRAVVRKLPAENLADGVKQARSSIILSPTGFAGWPSPPGEGDHLATADVAGGAFVRVDDPSEVISMGDVVVRINLVVLG